MVPGAMHDKKDLVPHLPEKALIEVGLGREELEKEYPRIITPHKKPCRRELTQNLGRHQDKIASSRVREEHAIGLRRRHSALSGIWQNRRKNCAEKVR